MDKFNFMNFKELINNKNLKVSSVGVGTYKGSFNEEDDLMQFNGILDSVNMGANVIDTCHNFRNGRSEHVVGLALQHLIKNEGYKRNNFLISSKAGYVRENLSSYIPGK
jgi:aryl-alcohol dehydrogenase-like predicted oxidoreductase